MYIKLNVLGNIDCDRGHILRAVGEAREIIDQVKAILLVVSCGESGAFRQRSGGFG